MKIPTYEAVAAAILSLIVSATEILCHPENRKERYEFMTGHIKLIYDPDFTRLYHEDDIDSCNSYVEEACEVQKLRLPLDK